MQNNKKTLSMFKKPINKKQSSWVGVLFAVSLFSHDELKIVNQFAPDRDRDRYKTCRGFFRFVINSFLYTHKLPIPRVRARGREKGEKRRNIPSTKICIESKIIYSSKFAPHFLMQERRQMIRRKKQCEKKY